MRNNNYINNESRIGLVNSNDEVLKQNGINLLNINWLRRLIIWKGFPYIFQFAMLIVFVGLIFIGWQVYTPENVNDKLFAKTNIVTLVIWGIWWPLMVWFAVTMGRVWCMICPLELVSNITERVSQKLGVKQKPLSKWIRSGAIVVFLYALIQLLVAGIHLHRIPAYTSFFLIGLLTLSAFVGFFFKDRAFCSGFCPIGMLLNAYGRGGMIAVRPESKSVCSSCAGKDCFVSRNRYKLDSRSCPSLLNPSKLNTNKDCLVCGQCIKSCEPNNMQLLFRKPFDKNDAREKKAIWPLTIFVMLVSGFVISDLTTEWKAANKVFLVIPEFFTDAIQLHSFGGFVEGLWSIILFPLLLWSILGLITIFTKGAQSLTDAWRRLALPLVVIISAGHLTKAIAKLNSWIGFLPGSIQDPTGQSSLQNINAGIYHPSVVFSNQAVSIAGIILLTSAFLFSIREEKIIHGNSLLRITPKIFIYLLYLFIVIGIGFYTK
jgi:polyferredoxin